jgi:ATP-dependent helicase/DNAse subunit B
MTKDKYSAVWVSHTSISDFLQCPRAYFLKNIYKSPKTGHKMKIISPALALGQAIHEVIDAISVLPVSERFNTLLMDRYEAVWETVTGKLGGFPNLEVEDVYKKRGREMIARITKNPGPLVRKAVKIKEELPYYFLSEEENIILCGKVDWLEYLEESDSVHIIDFKTSKSEEDASSLQLPIYLLLVRNTQKRKVSRASYWYLGIKDELTEKKLPDEKESFDMVFDIAKKIKAQRQLGVFTCPHGGCRSCLPYETIFRGGGEFIYVDKHNVDIFIESKKIVEDQEESVIL